MIEKGSFGKLSDGREVFLYSLKNTSGTEVRIINYGAIVANLFVKDKNRKVADVVLGYDSIEGYVNDKAFLGATVGRFANRISKGKFRLDGTEYQLTINDGENHLHGGAIGFHKVLWNAEAFEGDSGASLRLATVSPHGNEGYPGTVTISVVYTLTEEDEVKIHYEGKTDKPTILSPTHHSYFNLTGDFTKTILDHELRIDADKTTPVDPLLIPTEKLADVEKTPMDFRTSTRIGLHINDNTEQLRYGRGYDHNWVLNRYDSTVRNVASVYDPRSGRLMEVLTDQPGLQFYSGNFLDGSIIGKSGLAYRKRTGLCLETQHFPDSPNRPQFPSVTLKPGETYRQTTVYKFSVQRP